MPAASLALLHPRFRRWWATDQQRTQDRITSSHEALVCAWHRDRGTISPSLRTLAGRGGMIMGRSSGGKAEALRLPPAGQKWAAPLVVSGDSGQ
jgi:hypothetical protein